MSKRGGKKMSMRGLNKGPSVHRTTGIVRSGRKGGKRK